MEKVLLFISCFIYVLSSLGQTENSCVAKHIEYWMLGDFNDLITNFKTGTNTGGMYDSFQSNTVSSLSNFRIDILSNTSAEDIGCND